LHAFFNSYVLHACPSHRLFAPETALTGSATKLWLEAYLTSAAASRCGRSTTGAHWVCPRDSLKHQSCHYSDAASSPVTMAHRRHFFLLLSYLGVISLCLLIEELRVRAVINNAAVMPFGWRTWYRQQWNIYWWEGPVDIQRRLTSFFSSFEFLTHTSRSWPQSGLTRMLTGATPVQSTNFGVCWLPVGTEPCSSYSDRPFSRLFSGTWAVLSSTP
jgi:hypothetical protein